MAWPRNERIHEMHALYMTGLSLAQVGVRFGRSRTAVRGLFVYNGLPTRGPKAPLPSLDFNGCKYTLRNNGYYGKTYGTRTLMHRDVWEFHCGKIPDGYDIHHIDLDRRNNRIENLECLPKSEHTRKYSPHNNQYTKGRSR